MAPSRLLPTLVTPLTTLAVLGCGGGSLVLPTDAGPVSIQVVQGDQQVGSAGLPLADPLVVRLVDQEGNGIPNRPVRWVISTGGGSVDPGTGTTGQDGLASATWTLGPSGGTHRLSVVVSGVAVVTFTATAGDDDDGGDGPSASRSTVAADPASIQAVNGTSTITVTVLDGDGDPVEGARVTLEATGTGNSLTQPSGTTGSDGVATATFRSTAPGTKTISATVNGSVEISQTAEVTVVQGAATRVESIAGDDQTAPVGTPVPVRPAVRVTDELGRPVAGFEVAFVVTGGGGSVSGASQTTNSDGIARVGAWTLGTSPGSNALEARAGTLEGSPVVFTAEATSAGDVDHFVFLVQPRDVRRNEPFPVQVAMVDAAGNLVPLSGIEIYLGLFREGNENPSNRLLVGERFRETENGVARFDLRVTARGRYRLRALSDELPELGPRGPEPFLFSNAFNVD